MKIAIILATFLALGLAKPKQGVQPRQAPQPREIGTTCHMVPSWMMTNRIVGGEAAPSAIPWQVSVRQGQSGGGHFCGGTILDERTVMSAAHCFSQGQSMSGYYIAAGITNRNDASGQIIEIANGVWNSAMPYNSNTMNNDFVILKLSSALTFNDNVGPACLPPTGYAPESNAPTCIVSGWGTLESGASSLPTDLQWVGVPLITNAQCSTSYGGITDSMICAGLPEGGKDSCQGDSGGPLVCNEGGQAVLTGVVSFGIGCAAPNYPGVYARMSAILDWVKANMEGGSGGNPPAPNPTTAAPPPSGDCAVPSWQGDNFCDDENNTPGCNYDGGDCCGDDVNTTYCTACECLEPPPTTAPPATGDCAVPSWQGDNFCDDENNTPGCEYDGGDCCGDDVNTTYCSACECLEPSCVFPDWQGDGWCDDENNVASCNYDNGDCCVDELQWYCSACECIVPA